MNPKVLVSIVTYNSSKYLADCLHGLKLQTYPDCSVTLWDNASTDKSLEIAARHSDIFQHLHASKNNIGFCAAHNRVLSSNPADYALVLNPDVLLDPHYIENLVQALQQDHTVGSATGKLWRWPVDRLPANLSESDRSGEASPRILDTTGIYFTPNQRHFDRGSGESDTGQYEIREYVFGASGAAAFYRRSMLEDVKAGGGYFDEDFFAYREDADIAWRAQWMGWRCLYVPEAKGFHVRRVLPQDRPKLPPDINMHSFKNRFLLRTKNMDAMTYLRFLLPISARDLLALAYVLLYEHSSLRAFPLLLEALPRAWAFRVAMRRHRRISPKEIRSWFSYLPVAKPAPAINT